MSCIGRCVGDGFGFGVDVGMYIHVGTGFRFGLDVEMGIGFGRRTDIELT